MTVKQLLNTVDYDKIRNLYKQEFPSWNDDQIDNLLKWFKHIANLEPYPNDLYQEVKVLDKRGPFAVLIEEDGTACSAGNDWRNILSLPVINLTEENMHEAAAQLISDMTWNGYVDIGVYENKEEE